MHLEANDAIWFRVRQRSQQHATYHRKRRRRRADADRQSGNGEYGEPRPCAKFTQCDGDVRHDLHSFGRSGQTQTLVLQIERDGVVLQKRIAEIRGVQALDEEDFRVRHDDAADCERAGEFGGRRRRAA